MDPNQPRSCSTKRRRLKWTLGFLFILALLMGPGPGIYLINDYAASGGTILGAPALYAWAVFWCGIEALVVSIAYYSLWRNESE